MSEAQGAWVKRVLGIDAAQPAADAGESVDAQQVWRDAKDAVDARMTQLAGKLRATGHPDLVRIADLGLFGIGGGKLNVPLNTALFEYQRSSAERRQAAAQALRQATAQYRSAIASDVGVKLVDENPFGVAVDLRNSLTAALDRIDRAVS